MARPFPVQGWLNTNPTEAGAALAVNYVGVIEYTQTNGAFDLKVFREALCEHELVAVLQLES